MEMLLIGAIVTAVITLIIFKSYDGFVSWDSRQKGIEKLLGQKKIYEGLVGSGITRNELLRDTRYDSLTQYIIEKYFNETAQQRFAQGSQARDTGPEDRIAAIEEIVKHKERFLKF
jgi:hypothetical protein